MSGRRVLLGLGWLVAVVVVAGCSLLPGSDQPKAKASISDLVGEVTRVADEHGGRLVAVSVLGDSSAYPASVTVVEESGMSEWAVPSGEKISSDTRMQVLGWGPANVFPFAELQAAVKAGFSCPGGESPSFRGQLTVKGSLLVSTTCGSVRQPVAQSLAGQPVGAIADPFTEAGISTVLAEAEQVNGLLGVTTVVISLQNPIQGFSVSYRPFPVFGVSCTAIMGRDLTVKGADGAAGISLGSCNNMDPSKEGTALSIDLLTAPKLMEGITLGAAHLKIPTSQIQLVTLQQVQGKPTMEVLGAQTGQIATVILD